MLAEKRKHRNLAKNLVRLKNMLTGRFQRKPQKPRRKNCIDKTAHTQPKDEHTYTNKYITLQRQPKRQPQKQLQRQCMSYFHSRVTTKIEASS